MSDFHGPNTYIVNNVRHGDANIALDNGKRDDGTTIFIW
jgi:hypothetical protein